MKSLDKKTTLIIAVLFVSTLALTYGYLKEKKDKEDLQEKIQEQNKLLEAKSKATEVKIAEAESSCEEVDSVHVGCNGFY